MRFALVAFAVLAVAVTAAGAAVTPSKNGRIVFDAGYLGSEGYGTLYAINADGSGRVLITKQGTNATWSPNGKRLLFESSRKGDLDLWTINANGSGEKELTFSVGRDAD